VPDEIRVAVVGPQFEVPVVGRQPRVDHLRDGDTTVSKNQGAWRLLAAMAGVALDAKGEQSRSVARTVVGSQRCASSWPQSISVGVFRFLSSLSSRTFASDPAVTRTAVAPSPLHAPAFGKRTQMMYPRVVAV